MKRHLVILLVLMGSGLFSGWCQESLRQQSVSRSKDTLIRQDMVKSDFRVLDGLSATGSRKQRNTINASPFSAWYSAEMPEGRSEWAQELLTGAANKGIQPNPILASDPDDVYWDDRFYRLEPSAPVTAMAVDNLGRIYIGGRFRTIAGLIVHYIAMWDGTTWTSLGGGTTHPISCLAIAPDYSVYAGGKYYSGGDVGFIERWDGTSWTQVGSDINRDVRALAVAPDGVLYAGGDFTEVGGVSMNYIAAWDGASWSALSNGMNNSVWTLAMSTSGVLYAGGWFTTAGGNEALNIAQWNGTSWSDVGGGVDDDVKTLAIGQDGALYASGSFVNAGGVACNSIAKWNGAVWSSLGSWKIFADALVAASDGTLYAGGWMIDAEGVAKLNIAQWDGSSWSALGNGIDQAVNALALSATGTLYAGGDFRKAGGIAVDYFAQWGGSSWASPFAEVGLGMNSAVATITPVADGTVLVGGGFTKAGGVDAIGIAKWDGASWSVLGSGVNSAVQKIALAPNGTVYAGGPFYQAGGIDAYHVAEWDGAAWSATGEFNWMYFQDLVVSHDGILYCAGGDDDGGEPNGYVDKWDGSSWSGVSSHLEDFVYNLAFSPNGSLYMVGSFSAVAGVSANHIAKWDGVSWSALGAGVNGAVTALTTTPAGIVYVGGNFTSAGGTTANHISKWDGSSWSALGSGLDAQANALVFAPDGTLYAGGRFTTAGGVTANHIAKWDGTSWHALGSGVNDDVRVLAVAPDGALYVGGYFDVAGAKVSCRIGIWHKDVQATTTLTVNKAGTGDGLVSRFDNGTFAAVVGTSTVAQGSQIVLTAAASPGSVFAGWSGDASGTSPSISVEMNSSKDITATFSPIEANHFVASISGDVVSLEWEEMEGASGYNVYRSTTYDFVPSAANRIAENIHDEDAGLSGVQFSDNDIGGANVVGDINVNYFYKVTGLFPAEGAASEVVGEFDYSLKTTTGTDINEIVVLFTTAAGSTPITTAEELAEALPNCTNVYQWSATGQGSIGHPKDTPINNFAILSGHPYMVNVTADSIWSVAGPYSAYHFDLITTSGTDINHISVPLSQSGITLAEELVNAITSCTNVYRWDAAGQGTIGHPKGTPINNFKVQVGYPYYVNVTEGSTWPAGLLKGGKPAPAVVAERVTRSNIPHMAYGEIAWSQGKSEAGNIQLRAWIIGREEEVLTERSVGSYVDGIYWGVNVGNFVTAWQEGERLQVELMDQERGMRGQTELMMTTAGSDVAAVAMTAGMASALKAPCEVELLGNYPNPFNPVTEIGYGLPAAMRVRITIYDVMGREVKELVSEDQEAGFHRVRWDGTGNDGARVSSGVYLCRLQADGVSRVSKLIFAK